MTSLSDTIVKSTSSQLDTSTRLIWRFPRFHALDSLRGIAALTVALWHCYFISCIAHPTLRYSDWVYLTPLRPFINGEAAITLFFVLSGFVLGLSYLSNPDYKQFIIKRFCRIYIPFIAAIAITVSLYLFFDRDAVDELGRLMHGNQMPEPSLISLLGRCIFMTGTIDSNLLDPPMWTLVHELRISIIFPLLMVIGYQPKAAIITAIAFYCASTIATLSGDFLTFPALTEHFSSTLLATFYFTPCFLIGIALARAAVNPRIALVRLSGRKRYGYWFFCFASFFVFNDIIGGKFLFVPYGMRSAFYIAASGLLIALVLTSRTATAFLRNPVLQWLGKISYSFFLIHLPVLVVLRHMTEGWLPLWQSLSCGIGISLLLATVMNRLIEMPAISFGRRILQGKVSKKNPQRILTMVHICEKHVEPINIALILLTCTLAHSFPYHLFVFSYAVLGPAHYLTQISWLHDRRYFTSSVFLAPVLLSLTFLLTVITYAFHGAFGMSAAALVLSVALGLVFVSLIPSKPVVGRSLAILGATSFICLAVYSGPLALFLTLLLPTVMHVFVFTGCFMWAGALKTGKKSAYLAVFFLLAGAATFLLPASQATPSLEGITFFQPVVVYLQNKLLLSGETETQIFGFLSFAYTYHYLNWFSKAEVIHWHKIPRPRLSGIFVVYALALSIYAYSYAVGFAVILWLSLLHVLLEFPLDFRTLGALAYFFLGKKKLV